MNCFIETFINKVDDNFGVNIKIPVRPFCSNWEALKS